MEDKLWLKLGNQIAVIHSFARKVRYQHELLTISTNELDILSSIYLADSLITPAELSQQLGLKKESVSRTLKQLMKKNMVLKKSNESDERSYYLTLSAFGEETLDKNYIYLMKPYYYLIEEMGTDFDQMIHQLEKADHLLSDFKYEGHTK